jgi:Flp pilus assembly protein TadD
MTTRMSKHFLICIAAIALLVASIGCKSQDARSGADGLARHDTAKARSLNERAFALIGEQKYDEAAKLLRQAVVADVMFGPAHNNLGLVYYYQNKLYEAAWEFQNAIKLMPYQPEPRNNLGLVLERAGKMDPATDNYAKAVEMEPDNPEFLGNLARAKIRRGDKDSETKRLLEELVLKDPRPDWNHWARMNLFRLSRPSDESGGSSTAPQSPASSMPVTR